MTTLLGLIRRLFHALRQLIKAVAVLALAWLVGLIVFAETIPVHPVTDNRQTDAIVVLTGGSERLTEGLRLLAEGRAEKLFISGVYQGVDLDELMRIQELDAGDLACCIVLGYAADSTYGNAVETAGWMAEQKYTSLRLVTANYHMRRSLLEFRQALPDAVIVEHPVQPDNVNADGWWRRRGTASLIAFEYTKFLGAYIRAAYKIALSDRQTDSM